MRREFPLSLVLLSQTPPRGSRSWLSPDHNQYDDDDDDGSRDHDQNYDDDEYEVMNEVRLMMNH